ncbi:probable RNA methyltransferase CG11342 [Diorhabda sublineata]|uniref:probable RNA methyltransferase CG11342 n=1 Tax=Diorhabda sublineata TaxID=1163346 RepID=UPI0024E0D511|nr:probable RNA methyltransferase CG11342 [Diorhabda sublineata]
MHENNLQFKGGNPGAVQYGNFINYYQFHSTEERINLLPKNIWNQMNPFVALDVGCNAGNLTMALKDFLKKYSSLEPSILAVDIDPLLINRANEHTSDGITFQCLDIMDVTKRDQTINKYLIQMKVEKFKVAFCFSTTMWIHLNYGDEGLENFLKYICSIAVVVVIEPQPWKCYKTAVKRMKQKKFVFPEFSKLKYRENVESVIEQVLNIDCNMVKLIESERTTWERKLLIFKQKLCNIS